MLIFGVWDFEEIVGSLIARDFMDYFNNRNM